MSDPLGSPSYEEFKDQNRWLFASSVLNVVLTLVTLALLVTCR